jgi:hypothetical protein
MTLISDAQDTNIPCTQTLETPAGKKSSSSIAALVHSAFPKVTQAQDTFGRVEKRESPINTSYMLSLKIY